MPTTSPLSLTPWAEPGVIARTWYFRAAWPLMALAQNARIDAMFSSGFISLVCLRVMLVYNWTGFKIFNVGHDGGYRAGRLVSCFCVSGLLLYSMKPAVQISTLLPWRVRTVCGDHCSDRPSCP